MQDFNHEVLKAVNRKEPLLAIEEVQEIMSRHNIPLNLDFIYGLLCKVPRALRIRLEGL